MRSVRDSTGQLLGMVFDRVPFGSGTSFATPTDLAMQVGTLHHPAGHVIAPHRHTSLGAGLQSRQEVLVVLSGLVRVTLFDDHDEPCETFTIGPGCVLLLAGGGHGCEFLEETLAIEVKQGPYSADDKHMLA